MIIAIKIDKSGLVTGHTTVSGDKIPDGYDAVTEIENGIYLSGPNTVPRYYWNGASIVPRKEKDIRRDIKTTKNNSKKDITWYPSQLKGPLREARENTKKITELLFFGVIVAFLINLTVSTLFSLYTQYSTRTLVLFLGLLLLTIALFYWSIAKIIPRKRYVEVIPSAITINRDTNTISLPMVLKMNRRLSHLSTPFVISAILVHDKVAHEQGLESEFFAIADLTFLLTLAKRFHSLLNGFGSLQPRSLMLNKGPFSSTSSFGTNWYYLLPVEEAIKNEEDLAILRRILPNIKCFRLPVGMKLEIGLTHENGLRGFLFTARGSTLRIAPFSGSSMPVLYSQWNRTFDASKDKVLAHAVSFMTTIDFSPFLDSLLFRKQKPGYWLVDDYLEWMNNLVESTKELLDWLDDEDKIPDDQALDLVSSAPPRYRCRIGDFGLGSRDIVFDM